MRKIIFVHGCFWHRHSNCRLARWPKSKLGFWVPKLNANRDRDAENIKALRKSGWKVKIIWECQTKNVTRVRKNIERFLAT